MCCKNDSAMLQSSKTVLQVGILFFQPLSSWWNIMKHYETLWNILILVMFITNHSSFINFHYWLLWNIIYSFWKYCHYIPCHFEMSPFCPFPLSITDWQCKCQTLWNIIKHYKIFPFWPIPIPSYGVHFHFKTFPFDPFSIAGNGDRHLL
jgi:hypothetical protein